MPSGSHSNSGRLTIVLAAFVVIVAGVRAAVDIILPLLCAAFIAVLCLPVLDGLKRRGLPNWAAVTAVLSGLVVLAVATLFLLGSSLAGFEDKLPEYAANLEALRGQWERRVEEWFKLELDTATSPAFDPSAVLDYVGRTLLGVSSMMGDALLVLLMLGFLLGEMSCVDAKIRAVAADPEAAGRRVQRIIRSIERYFSIKTLTSLATGLCAGVLVAIVGVDFPLLWGFVAFLLNYVPNVGSFLAAIPPVLLGLVQPELGPGSAIALALGYIVINVGIGSVLEPRVMGRGLDLSTLVVLLSLVFWGWVFGPIGMLLSVPLTITVKIVLEAFPETRGVALFLGAGRGAGEDGVVRGDS